MKDKINILIADRNPHVRELLKREMTAEGYHVQLAENGRQLLNRVFQNEHLDLLIVDPDLPDVDGPTLLSKLQDRIPLIPLVVHSFLSEQIEYSGYADTVTFVEKQGRSIEHLKKAVLKILCKADQRKDREGGMAEKTEPFSPR